MVAIISSLKFLIHQIDGSSGTSNEEHLHGGVVQGDEAGEQVEVPGHKHNQEQDLRLARYSCTTSCFPDLEQEQNDCKEMRQISTQTEKIHFL